MKTAPNGTDRMTDKQTDKHTDGHGDSMTDPAQRAESVKILNVFVRRFQASFFLREKKVSLSKTVFS